MSLNKSIASWIEQVDAISEEILNVGIISGSETDVVIAENAEDMLASLKAEMQETLDTEFTNGGGS